MRLNEIEWSYSKDSTLRTILRRYYDEHDPHLSYGIERLQITEHVSSFVDLLRTMNAGGVYFCALHANNKDRIKQSLIETKTLRNQFVSSSFRSALKFINTTKRTVHKGDSGVIMILQDQKAEPRQSASLTFTQHNERPDRTYHTTSSGAIVLAFVRIYILDTPSTTASTVRRVLDPEAVEYGNENEDEDDPELIPFAGKLSGSLTDKKRKRQLKKLGRYRMDNFGNKFDY